ncbi:hypothetical protein [Anaerocolumna chitinilytica]
MGVTCVIETINKAKARRNTEQPLILHSDRGNQYYDLIIYIFSL